MPGKSLGQVGYEAYAHKQNWLNYAGTAIPQWEDVRPDIKDAWEVAAVAIGAAVWREVKG